MTIDTTAPRFTPDPPVPEQAVAPGRDAALRELLTADPELAAAGLTPLPGTEIDGGSVWLAPVEPGYPACDRWRTLRDRFERTGFWPVLVEEATLHHPHEPETVPGPLDGAAVLTARVTDREYGDPVRAEVDLGDADDPDRYAGFDWADTWAIIGDEFDRVALVPVAAPWLVPARLGWQGACNAGLDGAEHAAVLRRWHHLYRAELLTLGFDTVWLRHLAPLPDRETALAAAYEAFAYCPDAVHQDYGSLDGVAERLLRPVWRLWWD
ncbi:DUF4253 domain-containing protein [Nocardia sp. NPDC057353]|uniref:DUF4253 domain-containing protein n=1 Tax=Nocardia sp. NPDC057353 TaxID=3346104 RepID=UPI00362DF701